MQIVSNICCKQIIKPKYRLDCDFYNEEIIKCQIDGVLVEFCVVDTGAFHSHKTGEDIPTLNFYSPVKHKLRDIFVNVQSLENIIAYKSHNMCHVNALNQIQDVAELSEILARQG